MHDQQVLTPVAAEALRLDEVLDDRLEDHLAAHVVRALPLVAQVLVADLARHDGHVRAVFPHAEFRLAEPLRQAVAHAELLLESPATTSSRQGSTRDAKSFKGSL